MFAMSQPNNSELTLQDMPCYLLLCQSFLKYFISAGNVRFIKFYKLGKKWMDQSY